MTDKKEYSISKNFLSFNQLLWKNPLLKDIRLLFFAIDDFLLIGSKTPSKEISPRKKVLVVYNMALDNLLFMAYINRRIFKKGKAPLSKELKYDVYICERHN